MGSYTNLTDIRDLLFETGYRSDLLIKLIGTSAQVNSSNVQQIFHATQSPNAINSLIRLFLLGIDIPSVVAEETIPSALYKFFAENRWVESNDEAVRPLVMISAMDNYLFVSDAFSILGTGESAEFVLPANSQAALHLKNLMLHQPAKKSLDLCCGCGVHAVYASEFSDEVLASDFSARAVAYAKTNALLNGKQNITVLQSDLFKSLDEHTFDYIVSNPPFVITPSEQFEYRDNPDELDEYCKNLLREAPKFLNDGGTLQMLVEWVEVSGEKWRDRISRWVEGSGCDAWILRSNPSSPANYVNSRLSDLSGPGIDNKKDYSEWMAYLSKHRVTAIHPAMVTLCKRSANNWLRFQNLSSSPDTNISNLVEQSIDACSLSASLDSDSKLENAVFQVNPELILEQEHSRHENQWQSKSTILDLPGLISAKAEVDMPVLAFLNTFDGQRTNQENLEVFASNSNADVKDISRQLLPIVRLFTEKRILVPTN